MDLHRPLLALLATGALTAGLLAAGTSPAAAGEPRVPDEIHTFDPQRWRVVSTGCDGAPRAGAQLRLGRFAVRETGHGSLRVRTTPDTLGGPLAKRSASDQIQLDARVHATDTATGGTAPGGVWRVEVRDDVLTSDPVPLEPGAWATVALKGTTLHGDGWSGTIGAYLKQHGRSTWWGGFLTGGCLGSATSYHEGLRRGGLLTDFEAALWLDVRLPVSRYEAWPHWRTMTVRTRFVKESLTGDPTPRGGRKVQLWHRADGGRWTLVTTRTTDRSGRARATFRPGRPGAFQWRMAGSPVRSNEASYDVHARVLALRVNGRPAATATVPRGKPIAVTGRVSPGPARVDVGFDRSHRSVRTDQQGRFRVRLGTRPPGRYGLSLTATPRNGIRSGSWSGEVRVR